MFVYGSFQHFTDVFDHLPRGRSEELYIPQHLHAQYDELVPALCNGFPDIFPPELYTWEKFLWACELWYSNSMKIMYSDGKLRTCLIPLAGFLNHSLHPHIMHYGKVDPSTNSLKFCLSRPCRSGVECCLSYGNFSSSHFITFYGFLPQGNNPYDVIPLGNIISLFLSIHTYLNSQVTSLAEFNGSLH
ncbi:hypothetical protein KIW84_040423 [Lathyrus oleraceus]|uniref:SET domain-containing protein n=1 Tax=Pisum sativum TaxID=3888 RepID=A0A9D4XA65_PEA|nr:hypothetical protein KIW84_040423 [Pisum sativum]